MISKNIMSGIRALHLDKQRKLQQLFIAEGEKVVHELFNSGWPVKMVASVNPVDEKIKKVHPETAFYEISEADLVKISLLQTPNNILAVSAIPGNQQPDFSTAGPVVLMLDGIRDPGNLGTLIRTADWFGIRDIICSDDCVDAFNPKVVQSTMGSLFRCRVTTGNLAEMISAARSKSRFQVIGAETEGKPYGEISHSGPVMLVIGSESHGISEEVQSMLDLKAGIPRGDLSKAESLNAGVAGAILMAHFTASHK